MKMGRKKLNQDVEETAISLLDEDKLKTFIFFYNFIKSNQLGKKQTGQNSWAINYRNKKIGHFGFRGNSWSIDYFDLFPRNKWFEKCEKYSTAELKDFILTNIVTTRICCVKGSCHSVENTIILGKMFNSRVCACRPVMLINPDSKTLEYAKELVLIGKNIIAEMVESSIE
jgi:hypothetical protein